jgi:hypothetical protein
MKGDPDATPRRLARNPLTVPAAAPRPAVTPLPTGSRTGPEPHHRGLSLRPRDAIDPYALGRFAPDRWGISQLAAYCPSCNGVLLMTTLLMTETGLFVEAVCQTCSNQHGHRPGIYKRGIIPLAWGKLPEVEE